MQLQLYTTNEIGVAMHFNTVKNEHWEVMGHWIGVFAIVW